MLTDGSVIMSLQSITKNMINLIGKRLLAM